MNVLGLSCHYHDAAAALVRDGQIVAAAEEERFTRRKHDNGFPTQAIHYCLTEAGIDVDQLDHVVFYEQPIPKFDRILQTVIARWPRTYGTWLSSIPLWLKSRLCIGNTIRNHLGSNRDVLYCSHHLSHAASAYLPSGFDEAAVITVDGTGEWSTTTWGVGRGSHLELTQHLRFPHSVGLLFSAITSYLGFRVNDAEWKVMGLAPYGRPRYVDRFREVVDVKEDGSIRLNMKYFAFTESTRRTISHRWERLFGRPARRPEADIDGFHHDIARSGQHMVEEIMVRMARHVHRQTGLDNLCLAGGVALNCVANWRILQESGFKRLFIQPAAGDSGGALGAALYTANTALREPRCAPMTNAYLGPAFDDAAILETLRRNEAIYETIDDTQELVARTARLIADGNVVGWFQGRMEFGPRALGARSLLADPRRADMKDIINAKVKFREAFRPFAPAVLREEAHEYFDMPADLDAPFMLLVPLVREEKRDVIPAVTHRDGTGRVQTVRREDAALFHALLREFKRITGVPVLINTSFNVRGEPIVCTPADAYRTFTNTGIDVLVMGSYLVAEKPQQVDYEAGMQRSIGLEQRPLAQAVQ